MTTLLVLYHGVGSSLWNRDAGTKEMYGQNWSTSESKFLYYMAFQQELNIQILLMCATKGNSSWKEKCTSVNLK